jgi:hypothetical protein
MVALLASGSAGAQADSATVQGGSVTGVGIVNVAAGNSNQQVNAALISAGDNALGFASVVQNTGDAPDSNGRVFASVAPGAFAGSAGWLAINGAAGSGNQQANIAVIALGTTGAALGDTALSQARASHEPTGGPDEQDVANDRSVAIGDGAFANSSGLVQVSLIGGDRNSSANIFTLAGSASVNH